MSTLAPGQAHELEDEPKTPQAEETSPQSPTKHLSRFKERLLDPLSTRKDSKQSTKSGLSVAVEPDATPDRPAEYDGVPDGGTRAWLVVLGRFLNFWTGFGILNSFGTFQAYYTTKWPAQPTSRIALIGGIQSGLLFLGGILVGPVFDKVGARKVLIPGAILYIVSFLGASFCDEFAGVLATQGITLGVGNALLFYPTTSSISEWFDKKRGLALGTAASGSSIGGIFWPIVVDKIISSYGISWAYRCIALISTPLLVGACLLIKERGGVDGRDTHGDLTRPKELGVKKNIAQPYFLALSGSLFFIYLGFTVPFNFIPMYANFNGQSMSTGNLLLAVCYSGSVFGRITAGALADRLGRFNICSLIAAITGTLTICWLSMRSFLGLVTFSVLYGFFSGGLMPLGSACVAQITPNMGHIGLRIGVMMAICSVGTFVGGPICGALIDSSPKEGMGYIAANIFSGVVTILGGLLLMSTRCHWGGRGTGKWVS